MALVSDSWDVGQGAMDDAGGVVAAWEAIRLMKELGLRPKRTVRAVGWTAEEVGIYGGQAYAEAAEREGEYHVLGIESDSGVFSPLGFGFTGSDDAFEVVQEVGGILESIGAGALTRGGGGDDESGDPFVALLRIDGGEDDRHIGVRAVGDEDLVAVDQVLVAVAHRRGAQARGIAARARKFQSCDNEYG